MKTSSSHLFVGAGTALLLLLTGCTTPGIDGNDPGGSNGTWGAFSGRVQAEFDDNGRDMILLRDLTYTDPHQVAWHAPKGSRVNGASIPKAFWSIIGGPFEGKYRDASVIHDVACDEKSRPWLDVHRTFYYGMRCSGVPERKAKTMYYAVYKYGPRWSPGGTMSRDTMGSPGSASSQPTPEEVADWIERENPSLAEIESESSLSKSTSAGHHRTTREGNSRTNATNRL